MSTPEVTFTREELEASLERVRSRAAQPKLSPSRIVCAAIRYQDGTIIVGPRHFDMTMRRQIPERLLNMHTRAEQGFVDQHGHFLTRKTAWHVALHAGQITRRVDGDTADGGTLHSENLY